MYPPPYYIDDDPAYTSRIMREHSFAVMTSVHDGALLTTHLPMIFKPDAGALGTLYGHVARQNPQTACFDGTHPAMAVFSGPHAYISASWYQNPKARVPTWNYSAVHASGYPVALNADDARNEMKTLSEFYEPDGAWQMSDAQDYADSLMRGIVYFKMDITHLRGIRKMHERNKDEHKIVIDQLRRAGEIAAADEMARLI